MTDENVVPMIPPSGDRPVTWNDLQDLRRGLEGVIDVKIGATETLINAHLDAQDKQIADIRSILKVRLDAQDKGILEIKKILNEKP